MTKKILVLIASFLLALLVLSTAANNCKCWKDFEVTINSFGDVYCRDKKNRTFSCNEEEPPLCECTHKGQTVILDLGESNCLSLDPQNGALCNNRADWVKYFEKHPEYVMWD